MFHKKDVQKWFCHDVGGGVMPDQVAHRHTAGCPKQGAAVYSGGLGKAKLKTTVSTLHEHEHVHT